MRTLLLVAILILINTSHGLESSSSVSSIKATESVSISILEPTSDTTWFINKDDEISVIFRYQKLTRAISRQKTFNINLYDNNKIILKLGSLNVEVSDSPYSHDFSFKAKFSGDKYDDTYTQENKKRFTVKVFSDDAIGESPVFSIDGSYEWTGYNYVLILGYASIPLLCGAIGLVGGILMLKRFSSTRVMEERQAAPESTPYAISNPDSTQENGEPTPAQSPVIELPSDAYLKLTTTPNVPEEGDDDDDDNDAAAANKNSDKRDLLKNIELEDRDEDGRNNGEDDDNNDADKV